MARVCPWSAFTAQCVPRRVLQGLLQLPLHTCLVTLRELELRVHCSASTAPAQGPCIMGFRREVRKQNEYELHTYLNARIYFGKLDFTQKQILHLSMYGARTWIVLHHKQTYLKSDPEHTLRA